MKFKKFKIIEVLNWQSQKEIDPLKIKNLMIDSDERYPFYGQATINNGIIDYLSLTDKVLNNKDGLPTILIHSNNQNIVYLETPFYLKDGHGATSVLQSPNLNENTALYLMTCIKKVIKEKFTYNEKATKIALKNTEIELPIKTDESIDYNYMEEYIKKLKSKTKCSFQKYIENEDLNINKMTQEEKNAVIRYKEGKIKFNKFPIDQLFIASNGDTDIQQKDINGLGHIVISSGENNNGIIGKTDIPAKIFNKNTITIDMFGNVNFTDFEYKMVTHARVFSIKFIEREITVEEGLFIAAQMRYIKEIYSYNDMASWEKLKDRFIELPVNVDEKIDFDFINNYVKAIQRRIIETGKNTI